MARSKATGASKKRKPTNARRKPKARHGADVIAQAEKTSGFQRKPSWGQQAILLSLLGRVERSAYGGFAAPTVFAEADVQIRTMAGVRENSTQATAKKAVDKLLNGSGTVRPPMSDSSALRKLAAERSIKVG